MKYYIFTNQSNTILYAGYHLNDDDAWQAFWNECKYPENARDKENDIKLGIKLE